MNKVIVDICLKAKGVREGGREGGRDGGKRRERAGREKSSASCLDLMFWPLFDVIAAADNILLTSFIVAVNEQTN